MWKMHVPHPMFFWPLVNMALLCGGPRNREVQRSFKFLCAKITTSKLCLFDFVWISIIMPCFQVYMNSFLARSRSTVACGCWVVSCKDVSPDLDEPFRKLWWANHLSEAVFLERFEFETFSGFQNRAKRARCSVCHVFICFSSMRVPQGFKLV